MVVDNNNGPSGWLRMFVTVRATPSCPLPPPRLHQCLLSHAQGSQDAVVCLQTTVSHTCSHACCLMWCSAFASCLYLSSLSALGWLHAHLLCIILCSAAAEVLTSCLTMQSAGGVGAVKLVQVRTSNSLPWTSLTNSFGSAWEIGNAPSYPLDVNIVGADGESVRPTCLQAGDSGQLRDVQTTAP